MEALDSKGILNTLKKVLRQPWNALMLQLSHSLPDKIVFSLQVYIGRSDGH